MNDFFMAHWPWGVGYLLIINLLALEFMGLDKRRAREHSGRRLSERTLFLCALLGGSLGAILGMRAFHHKTKHWYFKYGLPAILLLQLGLIWRAIR